MTPENQALVIALVSVIVTGVIIPVVTHFLNSWKIEAQNRKLDVIDENVLTIEKATNSMKDQLVAATKVASRAEGAKEEAAAQKGRESEQAKGAAMEIQRQRDINTMPPGSIGP